MTQCLSNWY